MSAPSSLRRIVVVGTGTGVGKTWLGAELLRALTARGDATLGLKPAESGVVHGATTDAASLARSSSCIASAPPYRLADAVSPHLAARRVGLEITLQQLLTYVQLNESSHASAPQLVSLTETAGGLFSPLAPNLTNHDLARALDPAKWLLVAPDALGVLHDLTVTLAAARAAGRSPDAIALCRARGVDESTGTNAEEIARLGIAPRPIVFPDDGPDGMTQLLAQLLA